MAENKDKAYAALKVLAEQLGVDLGGSEIAIATDEKNAIARTHDGSLEATVSANFVNVRITSPRAQGIYIELVDHTKDFAPEGAIYCISAFTPAQEKGQSGTMLQGDISVIYVGPKGLLLSDGAIRRVAEIAEKGRNYNN